MKGRFDTQRLVNRSHLEANADPYSITAPLFSCGRTEVQEVLLLVFCYTIVVPVFDVYRILVDDVVSFLDCRSIHSEQFGTFYGPLSNTVGINATANG